MTNWVRLISDVMNSITRAITDVRKGRRPAPARPMTQEEELAQLRALAVYLPVLLDMLERYQVGMEDILEALRRNHVTWAGDLERLIGNLPRDGAQLERWLPTIEWALAAFQPAPSGKPTGII